MADKQAEGWSETLMAGGDLTTYEFFSLALSFFTIALLFVTVIVYYKQLKAMQSQLDAFRDVNEAQKILSLANFLQVPETRSARSRVRRDLGGKAYDKWTIEEKDAASAVCASYDLSAVLIRKGYIPREVFETWEASITNCFETLKPFINDMQENSGKHYWDDFEWIYHQAKDLDKKGGVTPMAAKS